MRRRRTALLLSAAFNVAAVSQAQAQATHEDTGPGNVSYTAADISGTPSAVLLSSPDGSVTATLGTVSGSAAAGTSGNVVEAEVAQGNAVSVSIDTLTATGSTDLTGLFTTAGTGLTSINVGSLDMSGTRGIAATSQGDVQIVTGAVRVIGAPGSANIDAISAGREDTVNGRLTLGGSLSVDAASVEVRGSEDAYAIHADVDGSAVVGVGAIDSDGEGVDIYAGGDVDIALRGNVNVAGGAVSATGDAVSVTINPDVVVTAGGGAIEAEDSNTVSIYNYGTVIATGANGETAQGAIYANASGAVTIVSNVAESFASVIDDDNESATIRGISQDGPVNITAGTTTTHGGSMYGILGRSDTGDVTIDAGTTISTDTGLSSFSYTAEAITASSGSGNVSITSDHAEAHGEYASAIVGLTTNGGNVTIVSGTASTTNGATIFGIGLGGDVSITTTGDTTSVNGSGIIGNGRNVSVSTGEGTRTDGGVGNVQAIKINATGTATVNNDGLATAASSAQVINVVASGTVNITSADTVNTGTGAAITASGGNGVFITADRASVAASAGVGISGVALGGISVLNLGSVTGSASGTMVLGQAMNGPVVITADDVLNSSATATSAGITAVARGGATIVAGNVEAQNQAIRVVTATFDQNGNPIIPLNNGHVSVETTGNITSRAGNAISISGLTASFDVLVGAGSVITGNGGSAAIAGGARLGDINVTNNGLVVMQGTGESGIGVTATGGGNVTVTSNDIRVNGSAPVTSGFTAGAISAVATGGNVTVTSQRATVTGADRYGITARTTGAGNVSVTSGDLTKDADGTAGIQALAEAGDVSVVSGTLINTGTSAYGIEARSYDGDVSIVSGTLVNSATGGGGMSDFGDGLIAETSGFARVKSTSLTVSGAGAYGILALGDSGVDVTTGSISAISDAVIAESDAGTTITADGAVTSAESFGINATGQDVAVTIAQNGSVQGAISGVIANGANGNVITNAGSISGGSDAAIVAFGKTTLVNAGTLSSGTGTAVRLFDTDDTVILQSGSNVVGVIDTGAGIDNVRLDGANGGTLAQFANAETLEVANGRWTTGTTANTFDSVAIASGAELQVNLAADGSSGIETGLATVSGTLALNYTDTSEAGDITGVAITGSGTLRLIGAGELVLGGSDLTLTGTTRVENGMLTLTGTLGSDVVTSGTGVFRLADGSSFTGDLVNNGTFLYDRTDSYTITGDFGGTGSLVKNGDGTLTFGGLYAFTGTTTVNGGLVKFTGQLADSTVLDLQQGTIDLSNAVNGQQTIAELSGSANGALALGATQLTVNQSTNSVFGGTISGTGGLTKSGTGTLNLTGTSTYSGDTTVTGGTLKVNGALPNSTVIVDPGATLGGNGTIGGLAMNGGTLAPGNSIGHLTVNGSIVFDATSVYAVEVNAAGAADRIDASGTATLGGAKVQVLAETGAYRGRTSYTILTAAGGVNGTFGSVSSNLAFLTPTLRYDATSVMLDLTRNDLNFAALATTPNARAVGGALQALGAGNALFEEALFLENGQVQSNFASLSGEIYAGVASGMIEDAQMLRRSLIGQPVRDDEGAFGWATLLGSWGTADATSRNVQLKAEQQGVLGGIGFASNGLNAALGVGRLTSDYRANGHADADTTVVTGTVRYAAGGFSGTFGASYAWHDIDVSRTATLGTITNSLTGQADGSTRQVFGEIGFGIETGGMTLTPFAGLAYVETRRDALVESGGVTALMLPSDKRHATFADLGLRIAAKPGSNEKRLSIAPYGSAAWRHAWGDRSAAMSASIGGGAGTFSVLGPVVSRNAAELGAGIAASVGPMRLSAGYEGLVASGWQNHSAQLRFSIAF